MASFESDAEAFTLVSTDGKKRAYDEWQSQLGAKGFSIHTSALRILRDQYPELCITPCLSYNVALLPFAYSGNAMAELDTATESVERFRYYYRGNERRGIPDALLEGRTFAKYIYVWNQEYYLLYVITEGYTTWQYLLKEPDESKGERVISLPGKSDALINAVGNWMRPDDKYVYVFDYYWTASRQLWQEVQKARWEDVILKEQMKKQVVEVMTKFFDSKQIYRDLGVPWKRGVIFHGPVGNGKTVSIKALMHSLSKYTNPTIPALYVKSAPRTWHIRSIFQEARAMSPCMLILEDIDTIVTSETRSYFFNEVDGLENNDGIFMVASTNHLDQLDPGLSSRPSRFDRKYLFPQPDEGERVLYCKYWRKKLAKQHTTIDFPPKLCTAIAGITDDFSFAYLKEAFVATLLTIAGKRQDHDDDDDGKVLVDIISKHTLGGGPDDGGDDDDDKPLEEYELWREMKKTVDLLRGDMGTHHNDIKEPCLATRDPQVVPSMHSQGIAAPSIHHPAGGISEHGMLNGNKFGGGEDGGKSADVQKAMMFDHTGRIFEQSDMDVCSKFM